MLVPGQGAGDTSHVPGGGQCSSCPACSKISDIPGARRNAHAVVGPATAKDLVADRLAVDEQVADAAAGDAESRADDVVRYGEGPAHGRNGKAEVKVVTDPGARPGVAGQEAQFETGWLAPGTLRAVLVPEPDGPRCRQCVPAGPRRWSPTWRRSRPGRCPRRRRRLSRPGSGRQIGFVVVVVTAGLPGQSRRVCDPGPGVRCGIACEGPLGSAHALYFSAGDLAHHADVGVKDEEDGGDGAAMARAVMRPVKILVAQAIRFMKRSRCRIATR